MHQNGCHLVVEIKCCMPILAEYSGVYYNGKGGIQLIYHSVPFIAVHSVIMDFGNLCICSKEC